MENIKILTKTEMEAVEGGNASLDMQKKYLNKMFCLSEAAFLIISGSVTGMSETDIAKEIFAHAQAYYNESAVRSIPGIGESVANYIVKHADPIDIANGGDTTLRKAAYTLIWTMLD